MNGIDYTAEYPNDTTCQITTPSYRGTSVKRHNRFEWTVQERDTHVTVGRGTAANEAEALDGMTWAIANAL